MIKDTNPDHYKVDDANFVEYMNDPKISGFGNWMFANGYNSGVWASTNWISVKERLPDVKDNVLWYAVMNDGYGEIRISSFSGAINHDIPQVWGFGESFKPIYWMPLPEPPKEDD